MAYADRYGLLLVTPPSAEPLDIDGDAGVKNYLRVEHNADDGRIRAAIKAARQDLEREAGLALLTQTWQLTLDRFPCGVLELPRAPLQSVSSITYVDTAGTPQAWAASNYDVDAAATPGRIAPVYGTYWPITQRRMAAVTVRYVAGYASADLVPETILETLRQLVGLRYEYRTVPDEQVRDAIHAMLGKHWTGAYS